MKKKLSSQSLRGIVLVVLVTLITFCVSLVSGNMQDNSSNTDTVDTADSSIISEDSSVIDNLVGVNANDLEVSFYINDNAETIKLWQYGTVEDGDTQETAPSGSYYAFLPSGADLENVRFSHGTDCFAYTLNNQVYYSDNVIRDLKLNQVYSVYSNDTTIEVIFMQSANLPSVYITTESGNMAYLRADKENQEAGNITIIDSDGELDCESELKWVSGRGNQTWELNKRGFGFKLSRSRSLLGMTRAEKWVLLANAYDDADGLRNEIAYSLAEEVGLPYSSHLEFVDVYFNGTYAGTYQLAERIDVSSTRFDIGDLDEANKTANPDVDFDTLEVISKKLSNGTFKRYSKIKTPDNYSGAYILERNYGQKLYNKDYIFSTSHGDGFVVRFPSSLSKTEADYISNIAQSAENALFSKKGIDKTTSKRYTELIDLDSFVKKYLVDEVTKNEGAGSTSSYFYKKQNDDLLYAGPAWDYDKSLGRTRTWINPEGITYSSLHDSSTQWWKKLYSKSDAYEQIVSDYKNLYRPYMQKVTSSLLDEWAEKISASYQMDWVRWGDSFLAYKYPLDMIGKVGNLDDSVEYLKTWINQRLSFLDSVWTYGEVYHCVKITGAKLADTEYEYLYVKDGESLGDKLKEATDYAQSLNTKKTLYKWTCNGEKFSKNTKVTEDITIKANWKKK